MAEELKRLNVLFVVALLLLPPIAVAGSFPVPHPVATVILVRHAEKGVSTTKPADPPLSEAGVARAAELARILTGVPIAAIYVTPYERTRKTAAPIAEKLGLKPVELKVGKSYGDDVAQLVYAKHAGQTILVVGHSNTTTEVIRQLGVTDVSEIPDTEYDDLFIVTLSEGAAPKLLTLRYGAPAR